MRVRAADLAAPLGLPEGASLAQVLAKGPQAASYVAGHLGVDEGGGAGGGAAEACLPSWDPPAQAPAASEPTVSFGFRFQCGRAVRTARLRYDLFFDLDELHSGFASVRIDQERLATVIFRRDARAVVLDRPIRVVDEIRAYLVLGIEHIFTGYDHLAFLAALVLGATLASRTGRGTVAGAASTRVAVVATLRIVTAFTAAHTLTLLFAALRPEVVPTRWVEPAIALSVVLVACENLLPRPPRRRWLVAFGLGLVHGFGFASVLREVGLPRQGLLQALLAFNLGVELGQVVLVALALPLLLGAARYDALRFERLALRGGSVGLALAGAIWFVARL